MPPNTEKRPRTPTESTSNPANVISLLSSPTSPTHKKSRTGLSSNPVADIDTNSILLKTIADLPPAMKNSLLYQAAQQLPSLGSQILDAAQSAPALTFKDEIDRVELCLMDGDMNPTSGMIPDAHEELPEVLNEVLEKAGEGTKYETKRNAIVALVTMLQFMSNLQGEVLDDEETEEWIEFYVDGVETVVGRLSTNERQRLPTEQDWQYLQKVSGMVSSEDLKVLFERLQRRE